MKLVKSKQGPFSYIVENLDVADDERALVKEAHRAVTSELGHGVAWDAARTGARAHRVRRYWQNVIPELEVREQLARMQCPMSRLVQDILEPGHRPAQVTVPDFKAQYPCNEVGAPRQAWPTITASAGSYAFSKKRDQPGPGMVEVVATGEWEEPLAVERERAMGYLRNATAAPGVTEEARRRALGGAIDQHALVWLIRGIHLMARVNREEEEKEEEESGDVPDLVDEADLEREGAVGRLVLVPAEGTKKERQWAIGDGLVAEQQEQLKAVLRQTESSIRILTGGAGQV
ncbi:unnamed protein product [Closterium sp. NIES-53]